ncbi:MAG: RsmD family RNA methyltransferase [Phycisphaeraceae bacterium]|nr:RsmD family RNA methyltransferase [Phycisphaeraceae bacterium]
MRIIGGTHRHRRFLAPEDNKTTRPITDRVKTALFDRLTNLQALDGPVLDLFSGTGSLGLETLSRETSHCTFIERNRKVRALLERNLDELGFKDRATVLSMDILGGAWLMMLPHTPLGLIFLDPPYAMLRDDKDRAALITLAHRLAEISEPEAVLVLRTDEHDEGPPLSPWQGPDSYRYGSMTVHLYNMPPAG